MASALLEELKTMATVVKKSQIEDAVGSSWAALAAEEDPQGRRTGTLLVEARAGGGGGEEESTGGGGAGGRWESGGVGILSSDNIERIRWLPSLMGRMT